MGKFFSAALISVGAVVGTYGGAFIAGTVFAAFAAPTILLFKALTQ